MRFLLRRAPRTLMPVDLLRANVLIGLLMLCSWAAAQTGSSITGTVLDQTGAAVSGARVTSRDLNTGAERTTETDPAGQYQLLSLPVGNYEVAAQRSGFTDEVRTGIHLAVGQVAAADLRLHPAGTQERVVVNADANVVSVNPSDISGLVREQQVKDLPLNGRSYDELLTLNPGVVNFTAEKTGGSASQIRRWETIFRFPAIGRSRIFSC